VISLPEPLYKDKSKDESILYRPTLNANQTTILNDSAELPVKDTEQLLTPSRMVSPDLPKINTTLGGLQDDILDIIEAIPTQLGLPELLNTAL